MSKNFEQALAEMLEDDAAKDRMLTVAKEELENRIREQFKWNLPDVVSKECNDFIAEHVAPEIRSHLLSKKGAIIAAAKKSADEIGEKISGALTAKVEKTMSDSWGANKVLDAIFK